MNSMTTAQLKAMKERHEDFLLVNTLDEEHFPQTRIPDSINIPQSADDFVSRVEQEAGSKNRMIVVYCANKECSSSPTAAKKLEEVGFSHVFDFEAGAEGWQQAGEKLTVG